MAKPSQKKKKLNVATPKAYKPLINIDDYFRPVKKVTIEEAKSKFAQAKSIIEKSDSTENDGIQINSFQKVIDSFKEDVSDSDTKEFDKYKLPEEKSVMIPLLELVETVKENSFTFTESFLLEPNKSVQLEVEGGAKDNSFSQNLYVETLNPTAPKAKRLDLLPDKYLVVYQHLENSLRRMYFENGNVHHFRWTEIKRYCERSNNRDFELSHLKQILFVFPGLFLISPLLEGRLIDYKIQLNRPFLEAEAESFKPSELKDTSNGNIPFRDFRRKQEIVESLLEQFLETLLKLCLDSFNKFLVKRKRAETSRLPHAYHPLFKAHQMTPDLEQATLEAETMIRDRKAFNVLEALRQHTILNGTKDSPTQRSTDPVARSKAALAKFRQIIKEKDGVQRLFATTSSEATLTERKSAVQAREALLLAQAKKDREAIEIKNQADAHQPIPSELQEQLKVLPKFIIGLVTYFFTVKDPTRGEDLNKFLTSLCISGNEFYTFEQKKELAKLAAQLFPTGVSIVKDKFFGELILCHIEVLTRRFVLKTIRDYEDTLKANPTSKA